MKAKKWLAVILSMLMAFVLALGVAACGGDDSGDGGTHEHTFNTAKWEHDDTNHWHPATCEHLDLKNGEAPHYDNNDDGKCDACEYVMDPSLVGGDDEHTDTFNYTDNGDGTHNGTASCGNAEHNITNENHIWGADNTCTKCHATKSDEDVGHDHNWVWDFNSEGHWQYCDYPGCNAEQNRGPHSYDGGFCECGSYNSGGGGGSFTPRSEEGWYLIGDNFGGWAIFPQENHFAKNGAEYTLTIDLKEGDIFKFVYNDGTLSGIDSTTFDWDNKSRGYWVEDGARHFKTSDDTMGNFQVLEGCGGEYTFKFSSTARESFSYTSTISGVEVDAGWYIVGDDFGWMAFLTSNAFTNDNGTYTLTVTLTAGKAFKFVYNDGSGTIDWDNRCCKYVASSSGHFYEGENSNFVVNDDCGGQYTFTFTSTAASSFSYRTDVPAKVMQGYWLCGDGSLGWSPSSSNKFTSNGNGTYTITVDLTAAQQVKVNNGHGQWYYQLSSGNELFDLVSDNFGGSNLSAKAAGNYTFTLTVSGSNVSISVVKNS